MTRRATSAPISWGHTIATVPTGMAGRAHARRARVPPRSSARRLGFALLFVIGTLKRGFPLHRRGLGGLRCLGRYRTVARYPMRVAGPRFAPMVLNEPGRGLRLAGELYAVDRAHLARLDRLEGIGRPGSCRVPIAIAPVGGGPRRHALVYTKAALEHPPHSALLARYRDRRFRG